MINGTLLMTVTHIISQGGRKNTNVLTINSTKVVGLPLIEDPISYTFAKKLEQGNKEERLFAS